MNVTVAVGSNIDTLRSAPTMARGEISHSFLENTFLRWSETTVAATLTEKPDLVDQLRSKLDAFEETFVDGYHPGPLLDGLVTLVGLNDGLRQRLKSAVESEFAAKFRPEERLGLVTQSSSAFLGALDAWRANVAERGVGPESAPLWVALRQAAIALRAVLADSELRMRWIP